MAGHIQVSVDQSGRTVLTVLNNEGSDISTGKAGLNTSNTDDAEENTTEKDTAEKDTTEKAEADPRLKDATVGSISDVKDLYQGPGDNQGRSQWLDKLPEDAEEAAENEDTEKYALIARKKKCFDGRKKFDIDSIIIQSPDLKKTLSKVFDKYPGVTCELDRLIFEAPFEPFVHRWTEFTNAVKTEANERAKEHLEILHSLLKEELKDVIKAIEDFVAHGVTTFSHLWAIFQPGAVVYTRQGGSPKAMAFYYGEYTKTQGGPCYELTLEPVGWGGNSFGRGNEHVLIFSFSGTRKISTLAAFPLSFHPEKEIVRTQLIQRGKKYESLAGYHYKSYEGVAISWDARGKPFPITVSGRVIIDAESFMRFNPQRSEEYDDLNDEDFTLEAQVTKEKNPRLTNAEANFAEEETAPTVKLTEEAAESVAESMHIPLYMMSAGDLGIKPNEIESALHNILEMVSKWNAILLLDECDVFLEARTSHDLERNKLVSIFLRTLEYYEGILFLTTNRVSNMDAAFQSRIHVSMAYPNLTSSSRRQIWQNFLTLSKQKIEISDKDLDELSEYDLNGRQIKNVLKTAFLISVRKQVALKKEFIETVLAIEGRRPKLEEE